MGIFKKVKQSQVTSTHSYNKEYKTNKLFPSITSKLNAAVLMAGVHFSQHES